MHLNKSFDQKLFPTSQDQFDKWALDLFVHQASNNSTYRDYINQLNVNVSKVNSIGEIPFMPIQFFKSHTVKTGDWKSEHVFQSSGTTGQVISKNHVKSLKFYQNHSLNLFNNYFGDPSNYHIMALLPSYLERDNSSLIFMVKYLIDKSQSNFSGFYLNDFEKLQTDLKKALKTDRKIILLGVSFALLDFVEKYEINLKDNIVMETGGMKGRRIELIREELHDILKRGFNVETIYSEYGMTELFSQAYSLGNGLYRTPSSIRVLLRDIYDPFSLSKNFRQGGINVIDLANFSTCSFIETQDIGRIKGEFFEVIGRYDSSDVRGCNLMI